MDFLIRVPDFAVSPFMRFVFLCRKMKYGYEFRRVELTEGKYAIIDPEDYGKVCGYKWFFNRYASTMEKAEGKYRIVAMHRKIIDVPKGMVIDHKNRDRLDNRKVNLRAATVTQNACNKRMRPHTSRFRGVYWNKSERKWRAGFRHLKKAVHVGYFEDEVEAAKAYDEAVKKLRGEFAVLNFAEKIKKHEIVGASPNLQKNSFQREGKEIKCDML